MWESNIFKYCTMRIKTENYKKKYLHYRESEVNDNCNKVQLTNIYPRYKR